MPIRFFLVISVFCFLSNSYVLGFHKGIDSCYDVKKTETCQEMTEFCHEKWMKRQCARTCGSCEKLSRKNSCDDVKKTETCRDMTEFCRKKWMKKNCARTCGLCDLGCRNLTSCPSTYEPVCGTDLFTYDNPCYLSVVTCQSKGWIQKGRDGKCDESKCWKPCSITEYNPVCASNGLGYDNPCLLEVSICKSGGFLHKAKDGNCKVSPRCVKNCSDEYKPVCGNDGITYHNLCFFGIASCISGNTIYVARNDKCREHHCLKLCNATYNPVCGSDGYTYENSCSLEMLTCQTRGAVTLAHDGTCHSHEENTNCSKPCTSEYAPVCGSNGFTYDNACLLGNLICKTGGWIYKAHDGKCQEHRTKCSKPCTREYDPVCGSNGFTYDNACLLGNLICKSGGWIYKLHDGRCEDKLDLVTATPSLPSTSRYPDNEIDAHF